MESRRVREYKKKVPELKRKGREWRKIMDTDHYREAMDILYGEEPVIPPKKTFPVKVYIKSIRKGK